MGTAQLKSALGQPQSEGMSWLISCLDGVVTLPDTACERRG
jgi:hypothetical protein